MSLLTALKSLPNHLWNKNFYAIRRGILWPESRYKRGILKRVQRAYQCAYFVETGTFRGDTPSALRHSFEHLWTIELDDTLFAAAKQRLSPYSNITSLHGDSSHVLSEIVPKLDKPTLFWLDGHYSGEGTATGVVAAPLLEELQIIERSPIRGHVVAIDDSSDFCQRDGNERLSSILKQLEVIDPKFKFYFDYDILFALPQEKTHREFWRNIAYPFVLR